MVAAALLLSPVGPGSPAAQRHASAAPAAAYGNTSATHADARLAVWDGDRWRPWWSAADAPARWMEAHRVVSRSVAWRAARPGVDVGVLRMSGEGEAWRFNVVRLRVDPTQVELALHVDRGRDGRALPWSVERTPSDAVLAINAGMFDVVGPWGWIVLDGEERQAPGRGPLSSAIVIDDAGWLAIIPADSIPAARASRTVRWAVQSYPTALERDGEVPTPLRRAGLGVNVSHRDARLAVATLRDGRVLLALTRFDGLGGALDEVPFGPTLPEMSAILGALGAQRAVFLDGGISAQMAVRGTDGRLERWDGLRRVPVGMVGRARK